MKNALKIITINLLIFVSLIAVVDWVLWGTVEIEPSIRENDPELFLRTRRNIDVTAISPDNFKANYRTNNFGMRGTRDVELEKPEGTKRVLVLGDSFTFGFGVEDDETYAHLLESELSKDGRVEVLNAGLSRTGTDYHLNYFQKLGKQFKPDILILGLYENDLTDIHGWGFYSVKDEVLVANDLTKTRGSETNIRSFLNNPVYRFLTQYSSLLFLLRVQVSQMLHKEQPGSSLPKEQAQSDAGAIDPLFEKLFDQFREDAYAQGIEFYAVMIPSKQTLTDEMTSAYMMISKTCVGMVLHCIDVREELADGVEHHYFTTDAHITAKGHAVIAKKLAEVISSPLKW